MFRFLLHTVTMFVFAAVMAFAQQPKLEIVGGETFDWGKVKPPKEGHLAAEIKIRNSSPREIKLLEIRPGCGCTKTDPDKMEIPSGEVSTMGVKLNINPAQSGPIVKSITVRWGDKEGIAARDEFHKNGTPIPVNLDTTESFSYISLKADIQRSLVLGPNQYFSFADAKIGQEVTSTVYLTNNDSNPITISDFVTDGGIVVNVMDKRVIKPGEKLEIVARYVPQAKGQITGGLKFATSSVDVPAIDIRAYGQVAESTSPVFPKAQSK
mgnify:CR=1 FL=1